LSKTGNDLEDRPASLRHVIFGPAKNTRGAVLPSEALIDVQPADGPTVLEKRRAYRDMERRHIEPASLRSLRRKPASATSCPRQRIEALGYAIEAEGGGGVVAETYFAAPEKKRRLKQRAKAFPVIWIPGTLRHRNDLAAAETAARSGKCVIAYTRFEP